MENTLHVDKSRNLFTKCSVNFIIQVVMCILCGLPHCIVCQDSLLAVRGNKTLIYVCFHCETTCFQSKSRCLTSGYLCLYINRTVSHALCGLQLMKAFMIETFFTLRVHSSASMLNNICPESVSAARMSLYSIILLFKLVDMLISMQL